MEGNQRASAGLVLTVVGLFLVILFHLGARGVINRGLQASLELVYLAGLVGAAVVLWNLRPGKVRRVAYALLLPAGAVTVFAVYLYGSFPLSFFTEEPFNLVGGLLEVAALWVMLHAAWTWSQRVDDARTVDRMRGAFALLAVCYLLYAVSDVSQGFTGMLHASALEIAGFVVAAVSLKPIPLAPKRAARAAPARSDATAPSAP